MDINKFIVFESVADTLNFTKSGEMLGYTQSGISHILKTLETELGFPLFVRSRQGVTLTSNARALLPKVRALIRMNEEIEQTVNAINGIESGHITIASFASISRRWLPKIIYSFREKYPKIEIELREGGTDDITEWILNTEADFGLLSHRHIGSSLTWIPLYEDPLVAVLPADYPVGNRKSFPIKAFDGQPFIISAEGVDYDIHAVLADGHVNPAIRFSSKDDHAIQSMVENHLGISILPKLVLDPEIHAIQTLPLSPARSRELGIAAPPEEAISPAAGKFIAAVRDFISSLPADSSSTAAAEASPHA